MKLVRFEQEQLPAREQAVAGLAESALCVRTEIEAQNVLGEIFKNLSQLLGRPIRVLDLDGDLCHSGLHEITSGCILESVGCDTSSVATTVVHDDSGSRDTESFCRQVLARLAALRPAECDCIVALRALHQVSRVHGEAAASEALKRVRDLVAVLIIEGDNVDEKRSEQVAQRFAAQLIEDYAFRHPWCIGQSGESVSSRVLYVASNRYWILPGSAAAFEHWTTVSNPAAPNTHQGTRRYYFNSHCVMKYLDVAHPQRGSINHDEWKYEIAALRELQLDFPGIRIRVSGCAGGWAWLVRDRVQGEPLTRANQDAMLPQEKVRLVMEVARILARLERHSWKHTDIRSWNIILQPDNTATLLDFGALRKVSSKERNILRPDHLEFLTWVREMLCRADAGTAPRAALVCPAELPSALVERAWSLLEPEENTQRGRFELFVDGNQGKPAQPTAIDGRRRVTGALLTFCDEANRSLLMRVQDLERQSTEKEKDVQDLTLKLQEVRRVSQSSASDWERKATALVNVLAHQIDEQRYLQRRISETETEVKAEKAACDEVRELYAKATTTAEAAKRSYEEVMARLAALQIAHEALHQAYRSEGEAHRNTKDKCAAYEGDVLQLRNEIAMVRREREGLVNLVAALKKRLSLSVARSAQAVKTQRELAALQLRNSFESQERALRQVQAVSDEYRRENETLRASGNAIQSNMAQLREILTRTFAQSVQPELATDRDTLTVATSQLSELCNSSHWWFEKASQLSGEVQALRGSTSWRITWPLRAVSRASRLAAHKSVSLAAVPIQGARRCMRPALIRAMAWVLRRPSLARAIAQRLECVPTLKRHLRRFAVHRGLILDQPSVKTASHATNGLVSEVVPKTALEARRELGPRARMIYDELQLILSKQEGGADASRH